MSKFKFLSITSSIMSLILFNTKQVIAEEEGLIVDNRLASESPNKTSYEKDIINNQRDFSVEIILDNLITDRENYNEIINNDVIYNLYYEAILSHKKGNYNEAIRKYLLIEESIEINEEDF